MHVLTLVFHNFILWNLLSNLNIKVYPVNILTKFYVCNQFTKFVQQWSSMITRGGDSNVMFLPRQTKFINYILIHFGGTIDYE